MQTTTNANQEYFSLAGAYGLLADHAQKTNAPIFKQASTYIDERPIQGMRAIAYISHLLNKVEPDEGKARQIQIVNEFIADASALFARMLEHQNEQQLIDHFGKQ